MYYNKYWIKVNKYCSIRNSKICDGLGLFADIDIKKDIIITTYNGFLCKNSMYDNTYAIEYDEEKTLIGLTNLKYVTLGAAQFANDAISPDITGKNNNSFFEQKGKDICLIASQKINCNDEILVPYGIDYWKNKIKINPSIFSKKFIDNVNKINQLKSILYNIFEVEILDYRGIENGFLNITTVKNKRKCLFTKKYHRDNNFEILLSKDNDYTYIYYICNICKKAPRRIYCF
jgi:hypothetical protein